MILVSGLPGSGNQFIRHRLDEAVQQRARLRWKPPERVAVWHGPASWGPAERCEEPLRMVIPVRDPRCRVLSMLKRKMNLDEFPELECRAAVLRLAVEKGAEVKIVSYEALCADPGTVGYDLTSWLGCPTVDWPAEDGNAKWVGVPVVVDGAVPP